MLRGDPRHSVRLGGGRGLCRDSDLASGCGAVIPVALRRWRKNLLQTWKSGEWAAFKQRLREAATTW